MVFISSVTSSPSPIQVPAAIFLPSPVQSWDPGLVLRAAQQAPLARARPGTQQAIGRPVRLRLSPALFTSVQPLPSAANAGPRDRFDRSIGLGSGHGEAPASPPPFKVCSMLALQPRAGG